MCILCIAAAPPPPFSHPLLHYLVSYHPMWAPDVCSALVWLMASQQGCEKNEMHSWTHRREKAHKTGVTITLFVAPETNDGHLVKKKKQLTATQYRRSLHHCWTWILNHNPGKCTVEPLNIQLLKMISYRLWRLISCHTSVKRSQCYKKGRRQNYWGHEEVLGASFGIKSKT